MQKKHKVFLSYSWLNKNIADEIDEIFTNMPLHITRDIRDLGDFERIKDFMKKIRNNDYVVIVISENYLKSKYCMYEILEIFKEANFKDRILPLLLLDEEISSPHTRAKYIHFWKNEYTTLKQSIEKIDDVVATTALLDDLKMFSNIYHDIDEVTAIIFGTKCPRTVVELFCSICKKLKLPISSEQEPTNTYSDIVLECDNCKNRFIFTAFEQEFYSDQKMNAPQSCRLCREENRHFDSFSQFYVDNCWICNQECLIPFKPSAEQPVYCDDCYNCIINESES